MDREWSRSRFWLCHFLQSRHERLEVDFATASNGESTVDAELYRWLATDNVAPPINEAQFVGRAATRYADDPAFVQCLRLMIKERQAHALLIDQLRSRANVATRARSIRTRTIAGIFGAAGPRFEMSIFLLADIIDLSTLKLLQLSTTDSVIRNTCEAIRHDRATHIAFLAERLTVELADLNFIRRNLRRLRLRGLFAAILADAGYRRGRLLRACGSTQRSFVGNCWRSFQQVLEQMVPYHRDALVNALLMQREKPYEKPRL